MTGPCLALCNLKHLCMHLDWFLQSTSLLRAFGSWTFASVVQKILEANKTVQLIQESLLVHTS